MKNYERIERIERILVDISAQNEEFISLLRLFYDLFYEIFA